MTGLFWRALALLAAAGIGMAVALIVSPILKDLDRRSDWILIRSYVGTLDPVDGPVRVSVFMSAHEPSPSDSTIFAQNRIEIRSAAGYAEFEWPTSTDFSGSICDVIDLDSDGVKEFLIRGRSTAKVVSYRQGVFRFRDATGVGGDEIYSAEHLDVLDIDGDGRLDFVTFSSGSPETPGAKPPSLQVMWWSQQGFTPAPGALAGTYGTRYGAIRR